MFPRVIVAAFFVTYFLVQPFSAQAQAETSSQFREVYKIVNLSKTEHYTIEWPAEIQQAQFQIVDNSFSAKTSIQINNIPPRTALAKIGFIDGDIIVGTRDCDFVSQNSAFTVLADALIHGDTWLKIVRSSRIVYLRVHIVEQNTDEIFNS